MPTEPLEHRPYPKIHPRFDGPSASGPWCATEKLHGANLVVGVSADQVRIGKRKAWLDDDEPFFGWQLLRATLEAQARALHDAVGRPRILRLYGELYGGAYPHPAVAAVPGASLVQTGISYAPDVRFAAFDALIEDGDDEVFLSFTELSSVAAAVGVELVPLIARGTRSELERLPVRFTTRVPASLGLPPLEDPTGNLAEGLVLRVDARLPPSRRTTVKRKIPEFDEARFEEALPWDPDAALSADDLRVVALRLVNGPRIASARSKVGTDPERVRDEVVLDVLIDVEAAFPRAVGLLSEDEEARLREALELAAAALA
ncbi:MAG: RNA ligase family protein [Myxococcota bacterium]